MDALLVKSLADIAAIQARVEAFKAFNSERTINGYSPGYDETHFFAAEAQLEAISQKLKEAYPL